MSEADGERREWRFYVEDMIRFCEQARDHASGLDREEFIAARMAYDATLRNLELVGEAATRVPASIREANPAIPWRKIIDLRNRLAHGYLKIDDRMLWSILRDDVPALLPALRRLLAAADEAPPGG